MPMQKKMKLLALRRQCRPAGLAYEAVPILLTGGGLHRSGVLLLSSSKLCFNVFIQAISGCWNIWVGKVERRRENFIYLYVVKSFHCG